MVCRATNCFLEIYPHMMLPILMIAIIIHHIHNHMGIVMVGNILIKDTVIKTIIDFEKQHFNITLGKDSVFSYIKKYISAYQFEEFIDYNYQNISLSKKVKAYCPYLVRYKSFSSETIDTVQLALFWIFPEESQDKKEIKLLKH